MKLLGIDMGRDKEDGPGDDVPPPVGDPIK